MHCTILFLYHSQDETIQRMEKKSVVAKWDSWEKDVTIKSNTKEFMLIVTYIYARDKIS